MSLKQAYVRDCRTHLRRAADLDPTHPLPSEILSKVSLGLLKFALTKNPPRNDQLSIMNTEEHGNEYESDGASDVSVDTDDDTNPSIRERVESNTSS